MLHQFHRLYRLCVVSGLLLLAACGSDSTIPTKPQPLLPPELPKDIHILSPEMAVTKLDGKAVYTWVRHSGHSFVFTVKWDHAPADEPFAEWAEDPHIAYYVREDNGHYRYVDDFWANPIYRPNWHIDLTYFSNSTTHSLEDIATATLSADFGLLPNFGDEQAMLKIYYPERVENGRVVRPYQEVELFIIFD